MLRLPLRLISILVVLSFFEFKAYASEDEFDDLTGNFTFTSSFNGSEWVANLGNGEPFTWESVLNITPLVPANNNIPKEKKEVIKEEQAKACSLTKAEEANVRKHLTHRNIKNGRARTLLHTLKTDGPCEYKKLRDAVTTEGKIVYTLCAKCRDFGWIKTNGPGIWQITNMGIYALGLLEQEADTPIVPALKRTRKPLEYDDDEILEERKARKKKPSNTPQGTWPEEFRTIKKRDMHLRMLKILETGYPATADGLSKQYKGQYKEKLEQAHNNLKTQLSKGWIIIDAQTNKYSITQAGLNLIATIENRNPTVLPDAVREESQEVYVNIIEEDVEEDIPPVAREPVKSPPRRIRSENDLEELLDHEEKEDLPRAAAFKKLKPETEPEPQKPAGLSWENLPDKTQLYLRSQLENSVIPSVLSDQAFMDQCLNGNFMRNLQQETSRRFVTQFAVNIDHWLDAFLRGHLEALFANQKSK